MALPGQASKIRWVGGDATLEQIGAMDPPEGWGLLVEDSCRGLPQLPGEVGPMAGAARLHLARRNPSAPPKQLE
eukprot:5507816-Heterocapsa_arctica.AAC.1